MAFEWMTARLREGASLHILGVCHSLKMKGINAAACATFVVEFAAFWDGPAQHDVAHTMS
jgi:hypothetical protein